MTTLYMLVGVSPKDGEVISFREGAPFGLLTEEAIQAEKRRLMSLVEFDVLQIEPVDPGNDFCVSSNDYSLEMVKMT